MARNKDFQWNAGEEGNYNASVALLMDIRDELKNLNQIFNCSNFTSLPSTIAAIKRNTGRIPTQPRKTK